MKERFLPIGTIVILKDDSEKIMITSYCIFPKGKTVIKGKEETAKRMFEYGGCIYPEGVEDTDVVLVFDHKDIEKVVHLGYCNDAQKKLSSLLNQHYDQVKADYESGKLTAKQLQGIEE